MILLHSDEVDKDAAISENCWKGETVYICVSITFSFVSLKNGIKKHIFFFQDLRDDAILRSHVQRQVLLLVVFNAMHLPVRRREIQETLGPGLELRSENRPSNYVVAESIVQLKVLCQVYVQTTHFYDSFNFFHRERFTALAKQLSIPLPRLKISVIYNI